jgi:dynein heavy chain, axonemal
LTEKVQRKDWVLSHIGQAVATVAQISWTDECEMAISDMEQNPFALSDYLGDLKQQLSQLTIHIQNPALQNIKRKILVSLITTDVHARDIVENLVTEEVSSMHDFNWQ